MSMEELGGISAKPDPSAPSIFTIVEVIVIDGGNKIPIEN
jgi:hypothetical protein